MLVRNFNPLWRRDSYRVMAKVNKNIDLVPVHKPIAFLCFAYLIMALCPVLFIDPLRNIMAHNNFRMSFIHFRSVASPCLLHLVTFRFPPCKFIQTIDEITLVKSVADPFFCCQLLYRWLSEIANLNRDVLETALEPATKDNPWVQDTFKTGCKLSNQIVVHKQSYQSLCKFNEHSVRFAWN
jgi:hypothetical protein